jgi:tetratricopeptide (TPR) repeat protein
MEGAAEYTEEEALHRQELEQRLRQRPNDRGVLVALADILASKNETKDALDLLQRASVGIAVDPDAAIILRKIAKAKLSLWGGLRLHPGSTTFVNCTEDRRTHAVEAVEFFQQACTYPENNNNPAAMIEGGNAKVAAGDLVGALKDFSAVVANYPAHPNLSAAICRAACLLTHLGDFAQAAQYFAYVLEDPPVEIGFGELEVRALLTSCLQETGAANGDAGVRLFTVLAGALSRTDLPPGFDVTPPPGVVFRSWGAPWRLLADRMLAVRPCYGAPCRIV